MTLFPRERGTLARAFVLRWAGEAQRTHGLTPEAWSQRLVPRFARAPAGDLHAALASPGFREAVARLQGAPGRPAAAKVEPGAPSDHVYTPLTPCRLVDTRLMFEGPVVADGMRSFIFAGLHSYRAQGGLDGDCGLREVEPSAVVVNLTAVQPGAPGYATLYPFGTPRPLASSLNYPVGDTRGNLVVVRVAGPASAADATLYTFARAHYVADVVGYYAPPRAAGLQCLRSAAWTAEGTGIVTVEAPGCPDGYSPIAANCSTSAEATLVTAMRVSAGRSRSKLRLSVRGLSVAMDVRPLLTTTLNFRSRSVCCCCPKSMAMSDEGSLVMTWKSRSGLPAAVTSKNCGNWAGSTS